MRGSSARWFDGVGGVYAEEEGGGVHAKGDLLVERSRPVVLHLASLCWNKNRYKINRIEIKNKE